ncbi:MAG: TRAP transporter small permease [Cumulibacter sp.]
MKVIGAVVSGLAVFGMMLLIVADVIARNWLGGSISGSFEYVQNYFMPLPVFPGLAYVYGSGVLPRMDLLKQKMKGKFGSGVTYAHVALELLLFGILLVLTLGHSIDGAQRGGVLRGRRPVSAVARVLLGAAADVHDPDRDGVRVRTECPCRRSTGTIGRFA